MSYLKKGKPEYLVPITNIFSYTGLGSQSIDNVKVIGGKTGVRHAKYRDTKLWYWHLKKLASVTL